MNNEELYETIEKADPSFIYNEKNLFSNDKLSINYLNDTNNLKNAKFNSNDYYSNSKPTFNKDESRSIPIAIFGLVNTKKKLK